MSPSTKRTTARCEIVALIFPQKGFRGFTLDCQFQDVSPNVLLVLQWSTRDRVCITKHRLAGYPTALGSLAEGDTSTPGTTRHVYEIYVSVLHTSFAWVSRVASALPWLVDVEHCSVWDTG